MSASPFRLLITGENGLDRSVVAAFAANAPLTDPPPCSIIFEPDAQEALKTAGSIPPDAILCLYSLHGSIPLTLIGELSQLAPVLILESSHDEDSARRLIDAGAQDVLVWGSFDSDTFAHAVLSAVRRHEVFARLVSEAGEYRRKEARLLNLIVNNTDGIVVIEENGHVRFVNPAAERLLGVAQLNLLGTQFPYKLHAGLINEIEIQKESGKQIVELRAVETLWEGDRGLLVTMRDVTARRDAELRLRENEDRYELAVRASNDGVWDWDLESDEIFFSKEWKSIVGISPDERCTAPDDWFKRIHPADIEAFRTQIEVFLRRGGEGHFETEHRILHGDGTWRWVMVRGAAVRDDRNRVIRMTGSQRDITERKTAEEGLRKALEDLKLALASERVLLEELDRRNKDLVELSITDGLTGLYNHRFIQERFDFEFKRVRRYGGKLSCMIIDIDHFKHVNDTYGHQFGDIVLREVSSIIRQNSREVDICGRYGGEEFMILTTQGVDGAMLHAGKLHKGIESHLFTNGEHQVHVTVSIGITEFTNELEFKQQMIERSDIALYQAKNDGRNLIRVWKEDLESKDGLTLDIEGIRNLKSDLEVLHGKMKATYIESTYALLKAVDAKDNYTLRHSEGVADLSEKIARKMALSDDDVDIVRTAALLHDIGKIGIEEDLLMKKSPLSGDEFSLLRKHPEVAVNILKDVQFLEKELPMILHHHERYDGTGYPRGLKAREIPQGALIIGVADTYSAMTEKHEYRPGCSPQTALAEIRLQSGTQFSPEVVDAFISCMADEGVVV